MATYIFHRLKMEKLKIDIFFLFQSKYLEFSFTDLFIEKSSMAFVQILEFDWFHGRQKGKFWGKIFFSDTIRWMKLILFIHVYYIILYIKCVFCCGQVRTLVAMTTFLLLWLYLAKIQVNVYRTICLSYILIVCSKFA